MKTYHDSDSVAIRESEKKGPDSSAVLVGSADNTGEMPEPSYLAEVDDSTPPITNRGALITVPLVNQFLIDWVSFTVKDTDPFKALKIMGLKSDLFSELERGMHGYRKSLRFGNIGIYFDGQSNMGCHVNMSGQGCRQYEAQFPVMPWFALFATAIKFNAKFTRLDIAYDNVDGALDLNQLKEAVIKHEIRSKFRKASETQNFDLSPDLEQNTDGHTLYFGKRSSRVFLRFYDKAAQQGLPFFWNRAELELKDQRAHKAAIHLSEKLPVGQLFIGILNQYVSVINRDDSNTCRCTVQPWWSAWVQSTEKIHLTEVKQFKTVDETMVYVKKQYSPTLAMIKTHLGEHRFNAYILDLIKDGKERMSMKHEQILKLSAQKAADNYTPQQEEFEERAAIMEYDGGLDREEAERLAHALIEGRDEP